MSKKRYLDTKFWSDGYIEELDPVEKLLFLYLLTNERTNVAGIYELPRKHMSVETGIEKSMLDNMLQRFEKDGKIVTYKKWVRLVNSNKHQNLENKNIQKGAEKVLLGLPQDVQIGLCMIDNDKINSYNEINSYNTKQQGSNMTLEDSYMTHGRVSNNLDLDLDLDLKPSKEGNVTNASVPTPVKTLDVEAIESARQLQELSQLNYSFGKPKTAKQLEKEIDNWGKDIEKLHRIDGYDYELIRAVIVWSQNNDFWKRNIRSGAKLRAKMEQLLIQIKSERDNSMNRVVVAGE